MDPDNPDIYYELGIVLSRLGKTEEAERLFARAQQKKTGKANKYAGLGRTLLRQGKLEQAEKAYRKAVEMAPGSADIIKKPSRPTNRQPGLSAKKMGR
jgi:Flp pilus assembly protein TadD